VAQRIVAFAASGEHEKESHRFSRCPGLAAEGDFMALVYRRCAGLDIHRDTVAACIRTRVAQGKYEEQQQTFSTFTGELKKLAEWLHQHRVKQVAMESTGVYWIPVWNVLEPSRYRFHLTLVNPAQVRAMAGHKTDRIDCIRIAEFLQHGRLAGSFIPAPPVREARALERLRVHLQQDRNRVINRIGRLLQTVNLKLSSVLSNIVGVSGLRILRALAEGRKGAKLAELAHRSLEAKKPLLMVALEGRYSESFRYLLRSLLEDMDRLDRKVADVTARLELYMTPHAELIARMCEVPGIDRLAAWTVLAETGADLSAFADAKHFASWAALCPGNNESGGKRKQGRTRKGNRYLRRIVVQAAWAAGHSKGTFLSALFFRLARRLGMKKAAVAVAHRILVILFHIIRHGQSFRELGDDYFDQLHPERAARRLMSRLERLGYDLSAVRPKAVGTSIGEVVAPVIARGRGRPCKCAERGLPCTHMFAGLPITHPSRLPSPPRPKPSPPLPPFQPTNTCRRCAAWKIPCIHVKPKLNFAPSKPKPEPSQ
jgi:transposase